MTTLSRDTSPEAERIQIELWQKMPAWRKLELVAQMNETVRILAMTGLRERFPNATPAELTRRYADLVLGAELAERAYGPLPKESQVSG